MSDVSQRKSDIWIGAGLLGFCAFAAWRSLRIKSQVGGTLAGPSFLPWVMIGAISALSIWLILRALRQEGDTPIALPDRATLGRMAMFALVLVAYAAAFMPVGYLISTVVTFIAVLWLFGERNWLVLTLFPAAMTGAVFLGFTRALQVWLP